MASFSDEEFSKLKATHYRGLARVRLEALSFRHRLVQQKHRQLCPKNVLRLQKVFEKSGCLRLQEENFISAIVDDRSLNDAVAVSKVSREELIGLREGAELPLLNFHHLECFSGLHRVEAAKSVLPDNDQWWVVRLFSEEIPDPLLSRLIELYSNEKRPLDGEVFRKIRLYHRDNDLHSENKWWAYLENTKPKGLRQLLKNQKLTSAFDGLIEMPGLWNTVQLGALQRLLGLKCEEEMVRYLSHIRKVWDRILTCGEKTLPYSAVDSITVEKLELLCPKVSNSDQEYVSILMQERLVFSSVPDESLRAALLANISNIPTLIPSLRTFFETLKYLEPLCEILKKLLDNKMKGTIRQSLLGCFFPPKAIQVQKSENCSVEFKVAPDDSQAAEIAYAQLWAFCGRNWDELTSFTPKKEPSKDKPTTKGPNPALWQQLAKFTLDLGFQTPMANKLASQDSASKLAIDYLRKANPGIGEFSTQQIQDVIRASSGAGSQPEDVASCNLTQVDVERRCGRPFELDLKIDKRILFLPTIYANSSTVDLHFVRQNLFRCILGEFQFLEDDLCPAAVPRAPTTSAPRKRRRIGNQEPDSLEEKIGRLEAELDASKRACVALRTARAKLEERYRILERSHAALRTARQIEATERTPAQDGETTGTSLQLITYIETTEPHDTQDSDRAMILANQQPITEPLISPGTDIDMTEPHDTQDSDRAMVLANQQPITEPLTNWESLIAPNDNLVMKLQGSYQHNYHVYNRSDYEIFVLNRIDNNGDIYGLSFPISSVAEIGERQLGILMSYFEQLEISYMHQLGQMVINPSADTLFKVCSRFTTCFVGQKEMLWQYSKIAEDDDQL